MNTFVGKIHASTDLLLSRKISDLLVEELGESFVIEYNNLRQTRNRLLENKWNQNSSNGSGPDEELRELDLRSLFPLVHKYAELRSVNPIQLFIRLTEVFCDAGMPKNAAKILEPLRKKSLGNAENVLGDILMLEGCVASYQHKWDKSHQHFSDAYDYYHSCKDHNGMASALLQLGIITMNQWDATLSIEYFKEARQNQLKDSSKKLGMEIQLRQAVIQLIRGDFEKGCELLEDVRTQFDVDDNPTFGVLVLNNQGKAKIELGNCETARNILEESLKIAEASHDKNQLGRTVLTLSEALCRLGKFKEATRRMSQAFSILAKQNELSGLGEAYRILGMLNRDNGNPVRAEKYFEMGVTINAGINHLLNLCETYFEYSILAQQQGDPISEQQYLERSLYYAEEMRAVPRITFLQKRLETI